MKRIFIIILSFLFLLSLFGCSANQEKNTKTLGTVSNSETLNENTTEEYSSVTLPSEMPEEYAPVLARYQEIALIMTSDEVAGVYDGTIELPCPTGVEFSEWNSGILEWGSVHDRYGYIVKDINGDDVPELFWVQEGYQILLAFTISDGEAVGLFSSRPKERINVLDSGKLLKHVSGGADTGMYTVLELPPNSDRLVVEKVVSYDCYIDDAGTEVQEYSQFSWDGTLDYPDLRGKVVSLTKNPMTKEEYHAFREQYPSAWWEPTEAWKQNEIYYID